MVAPQGRLDGDGAPVLKDAIDEIVKEDGRHRVVIDMSGVGFVDSTTLRSVIAALKRLRRGDGELRLAAPNEQARIVLELTTLDRAFPHYPTVEDALAGL